MIDDGDDPRHLADLLARQLIGITAAVEMLMMLQDGDGDRFESLCESAKPDQVLELRRAHDPDGIPLNRHLAQVYDAAGLPAEAARARARTGA